MYRRANAYSYHVINDYTGAGCKQQAIDIRYQPENERYKIIKVFRGFRIEDDAVEEKNGVDDMADKPSHVTHSHKPVYLTDCAT